MLSDRTLERVSCSYRMGYRDGYDGKPEQYKDEPVATRPFGFYDYTNGYKAGANDAKWNAQRARERQPQATDREGRMPQ